ncbi:MAG: DUF1064 domain-containing protein [Oscillospiraceae bacterium]
MVRRKYGNKKTSVGGKEFDSKKEARRYQELQLLQWSGQIQNLQTQVKYVLIPTQREASFEVYKSGPNKGRRKPGKVLECECSYIADFVYNQDGEIVVEDVKGYRDPASAGYAKFVIKRKLMLERYGIQIKEV